MTDLRSQSLLDQFKQARNEWAEKSDLEQARYLARAVLIREPAMSGYLPTNIREIELKAGGIALVWDTRDSGSLSVEYPKNITLADIDENPADFSDIPLAVILFREERKLNELLASDLTEALFRQLAAELKLIKNIKNG